MPLSVTSSQSNNIVAVIVPIKPAFVRDIRLITRTSFNFRNVNITPAQLLNWEFWIASLIMACDDDAIDDVTVRL